jgi:hypothetical protein
MGFFYEEDEIEVDDALINEARDLLEDMLSETQEILEKNQMVYLNKYKRILEDLDNELSGNLGFSRPTFLNKLFEDLEHPGAMIPSRAMDIKMINLGLKKILKEFGRTIPSNQPIAPTNQSTHNINFNNIQNMQNTINISNEQKIEITDNIQELEKELEKEFPNLEKVGKLTKLIKGLLRIGGIILG